MRTDCLTFLALLLAINTLAQSPAPIQRSPAGAASTLTVQEDSNPFTMRCPTNVLAWVRTTNGVDYTHVDLYLNIWINAVEGHSLECDPPSGSAFFVGTTLVTCVATDNAGNRAECSFPVIVRVDTNAPAMECPRSITARACTPSGAPVHFPTPAASDDSGMAPAVACLPPSGSVFPVGKSRVICEAWDAAGNRSACWFAVTVEPDPSVPGTDTNDNGLSDIWEIHFNAVTLAPDEDTDGDGLSNREEVVAGTSPFDAGYKGGVRVAVGDVNSDGLGDGSVRPVRYTVSTVPVPEKSYQLQHTANLGEPWIDLESQGVSEAASGGEYVIRFRGSLNGISNNQGFFRVKVSDVDEDLDGLTAWEEFILGTSDRDADSRSNIGGWGNDWISGGTGQDGTNSSSSHGDGGRDLLIGGAGGDRQAALDWIAIHLGEARLREVAIAYMGGGADERSRSKLVTAVGTGGWLELSTWSLDPTTHGIRHLKATEPFEGWNVKLQTLTPTPAVQSSDMFVCARIREDENLSLTVHRVDETGNANVVNTFLYNVPAFDVYDYAMAHQFMTGSAGGVESYLLITPIMGLNTNNQPELHVVAFSISTNGAIKAVYDTGNLGHTNLPGLNGQLQIARADGSQYVVSYLDQHSRLSAQVFDVEADGTVHPRGPATSLVLTFQGDRLDPVSTTDFALSALNPAGFVTLLAETNCSTRLTAWDERGDHFADATRLASGSIHTPALTDVDICTIDDLVVNAVISGTNSLRLDVWKVVAETGHLASLSHSIRDVTGLKPGSHAGHVKAFKLDSMPVLDTSERTYVSSQLDGGQLRLGLWRVGPVPRF